MKRAIIYIVPKRPKCEKLRAALKELGGASMEHIGDGRYLVNLPAYGERIKRTLEPHVKDIDIRLETKTITASFESDADPLELRIAVYKALKKHGANFVRTETRQSYRKGIQTVEIEIDAHVSDYDVAQALKTVPIYGIVSTAELTGLRGEGEPRKTKWA